MSRPPAARRRRPPVRASRACPLGKVRFPDHLSAVRALHSADRSRHRATADGLDTRRHEVRSYPCGVCRGYHLTSQPAPST